jgi:hypothetical protein
MGISNHFSKFLKSFSTHKDENNSNTPTTSRSIYSCTSSANSSFVTPGYTRDPMRCGNHPDVVGYYYDPMGPKFSHNHGVDATNTGA